MNNFLTHDQSFMLSPLLLLTGKSGRNKVCLQVWHYMFFSTVFFSLKFSYRCMNVNITQFLHSVNFHLQFLLVNMCGQWPPRLINLLLHLLVGLRKCCNGTVDDIPNIKTNVEINLIKGWTLRYRVTFLPKKFTMNEKEGQKITHLSKKSLLQAICSTKTFHENIEVSHDVL